MRLSHLFALTLTTAIPASSALSQSFPPGVTPVRGAILNVNATAISIQSPQGPVTVHLVKPTAVYANAPSDLNHVAANDYVGVTSVKGADGKEHATAIKIFPDALRGIAEGSFMLPAQQGAPSTSRMTNGSVTGTKTSAANGGSRMTNGAITNKGSEFTIGSQHIEVPANTPVTKIAVTARPLQPGEGVLVLAKKQADGSLSSNQIVLTAK